LSKEIKAKIGLFCNVDVDQVITAKDVETIYEVPLVFHQEGLDDKIVSLLNIWTRAPRLQDWERLVEKVKNPTHAVTIAIVGKYIDLRESYKSLNEALCHGGIANDCKVNLDFVDSESLDASNSRERLEQADGVLVPGGFGTRGIPGKIRAIQFAREEKVPLFGICLGMQMAVVEFARHVAGMDRAHSTEFDEDTPFSVIYLMKEWFDYKTQSVQKRDMTSDKGGTMRLGAYPCVLTEGSVAFKAYGQKEISERHRHRYEFNNAYKERLEDAGLVISGASPDGELIEIIEILDHPWFLGCQFHPEFKSRPMNPHPLFASFIKAALAYKNRKAQS
jgi:CTP synthase